jgi:hypothetical protein
MNLLQYLAHDTSGGFNIRRSLGHAAARPESAARPGKKHRSVDRFVGVKVGLEVFLQQPGRAGEQVEVQPGIDFAKREDIDMLGLDRLLDSPGRAAVGQVPLPSPSPLISNSRVSGTPHFVPG